MTTMAAIYWSTFRAAVPGLDDLTDEQLAANVDYPLPPLYDLVAIAARRRAALDAGTMPAARETNSQRRKRMRAALAEESTE